jgi:hypothetical protein
MDYRFLQAGLMRLLIVSCFLGIGLVAGTAGQSSAADLDFKPVLAVSEEYNDNIFQTSSDKRSDYITHISPSATFHYMAPVWTWDVADTFDYSKYAKKSESDQYINSANVTGKITLLDNFMYLDLGDTYHRVSLDVAQDVATQSSLFLNQTNQNIATISPYLVWRLGEKSTLKTGYRYTDTRYWGEGFDERDHGAFADFNYELTSKFSLSAGYGFVRSEIILGNYDTHNVYVGFKYQYAEKSSLFGKFGNTWEIFDSGEKVSYLFWDAGIIHDLGIAIATLETSVQTTPNPLAASTKTTSYIGKLDKILPRGAVGLSASYLEYENLEFENSQNAFNSQRKLSFSGYGRYEVMESLFANFSVTAERYYGQGIEAAALSPEQSTITDFRYHLYAASGLSYSLNHGITVSLNYTYETYRNDLNNATGAIEINRGIVEVRKSF